MDPVILGALGSALAEAVVFVGREFAKEALVKPVAEPVADQVRNWVNRPYDAARDDAVLQQAVQEALASGDFGLVKLKLAEIAAPGRPELRPQVAAAILSMENDQADQVPQAVVQALHLPDSARPVLARFLWALRQQLAGHPDFGPLIAFADRAASRELLRRLATTVVSTPAGPAVQVVVVKPPRPPVDLEALRRDYLAELAKNLEWLDFKGIAGGPKESIQLRLADIYVRLRAMPYGSREEQEAARRRVAELLDRERLEAIEKMVREREEIQQALRRHPRLVILGEPGSGKSTFLKYVTHALARGEHLGLPANFLPLLASVKGYAEEWRKDHRLLLETYLPQHIAEQHKSPPGLQDYLTAELEAGRCLILLDGLDEVKTEERVEIARRVQTFARRYGDKGNRLVVTSRIEGYWGAQVSGDFHHYILSEFGPDEIRSFAQQWCVAVERQWYPEEEAKSRGLAEADKLIAAILNWPSVRRLAANPLLLTIIALIHRSRTQLPHHRIKLYAICFETLVETWGLARSLEGGPAVGVEVHESEAVDVLGPLALWLHETRPGGTAPRQAIVNKMVERMTERGTAEAQARRIADTFLDVTREQCGLMAERGPEEYGFFHLTFEEYLAARDIARRRDRDRTAIIQTHWPDPTWREIILLTAGQLGIMEASKDRVSDLLEDLLNMQAREEADRGRNVVLAGRALVDVGKETPLPNTMEWVIVALRRTMQDVDEHDTPHDPSHVPVRTRAEAGEVLDELGWLPNDLNTWVHVPGGPVYLHHTRRTVTVPAFWLARYPVTNAQYQQFMQAGGYEEPRWWSDAGWRWRMQEHNVAWRGEGPVTKPEYWDNPRLSRKGYPVVGVCWYEAEAYCNWLTEQLQEAGCKMQVIGAGGEIGNLQLGSEVPSRLASRHGGDLPSRLTSRNGERDGKSGRDGASSCVVRLPTEEEWLLAAGGEGQGKDEDRFPWDPPGQSTWQLPEKERAARIQARANVWESQIGGPTPVGMYPAGASPCGVWDLAGNVWEWTASWYDEKTKEARVLRGGSWLSDRYDARCASRGRDYPDYSDYSVGFRVVVSPGSP